MSSIFTNKDDEVLRQVVANGMHGAAIVRHVLPHVTLDDVNRRIDELALERPHLVAGGVKAKGRLQ